MGRAARLNAQQPRVPCDHERCTKQMKVEDAVPYTKLDDGIFLYLCAECNIIWQDAGYIYVKSRGA